VIAPKGTPHPLWDAFLNRVTSENFELQKFLQRFAGYCCTGNVNEHVFAFFYGTGANGKGTFINTIMWILGDYATVADVSTFLASNHERHPTDLAKLHGARLVVAQETEKGRRWDEAKIKSITGGDPITARFMRQDFFDYIPQFKLGIIGNHKPRLVNIDPAMRRRLLLIPFTVQIPKAERDTNLPEKLKAEGPAILRWMIEGCLEWQTIGLQPPEIVTAATEQYFEDQDVIRQWLDECINVDAGPYAFTPIASLFASWQRWCERRGIVAGSSTALSDTLVDYGYVRDRGTGGKRGFTGLVVNAEPVDVYDHYK
jgi:putative DNA primase/helicase